MDTIAGRFDADEIERQSFKAPALRVAFLGAPRTQPKPDETRSYDLALAIFVLTDGRGRALEGIDLTQAVAEEIELNRFNAPGGVAVPENLRIDALYSGEIDDKGISLHSVSWTQRMRLGMSSGLAAAQDPQALMDAGADLTQEIDITFLPEGAL